MRFFLFNLLSLNIVLLFIGACQVKELSPYDKARNPYSHLGVEGYMGAALTSCLSVTGPPQGRPLRAREKKNGVVIETGAPVNHPDYFDCVDNEMYKLENDRGKDDK